MTDFIDAHADDTAAADAYYEHGHEERDEQAEDIEPPWDWSGWDRDDRAESEAEEREGYTDEDGAWCPGLNERSAA